MDKDGFDIHLLWIPGHTLRCFWQRTTRRYAADALASEGAGGLDVTDAHELFRFPEDLLSVFKEKAV